ncbi:MAG TPA: hypothetical protein VEJ63_07935 [Planctomycetota bacterium]|nr:hypothetical protein [Planctomycetota bacterium]
MKKWYALLALFVLVLYLARTGALSKRIDPGPLKPGNSVDARIARRALVIEGDPIDPLLEVKLYKLEPARTEIELKTPFSTSSRALFFFEPEVGAKYQAEVHTKHRHETIDLVAAKDPPPVEIARFPIEETLLGLEFHSDEKSVIVQGDGTYHICSLTDGKQSTTLEAGKALREQKVVSPSGRFIAMIQPPKGSSGGVWHLVVLH